MSYIIGIDLGTSNCALSYFKKSDIQDPKTLQPKNLRLWQREEDGSRLQSVMLPSFLLQRREAESNILPFAENKRFFVGLLAKNESLTNPTRTIASAKSWLCQHGMDRTSKLLPLGSSVDEEKISPESALSLFLEHLVASFLHETGLDSIEGCDVLVTVPASFDELAKALVKNSCIAAGIANVTLLEEPQAAFYAWLQQPDHDWRSQVSPGETILVCDIGGGTSDFSLISVDENDLGELALNRVSVGEHLLLGGDNMDLALAHLMSQKLEQENPGTQLDASQFQSLIHSARKAKEAMLSDETCESYPVAVVGSGSSLFSSSLTTTLLRTEAISLIEEGFFPLSRREELPQEKHVGLQEIGLQYEADPAITKHLSAFLNSSYSVLKSKSHESEFSSLYKRLKDRHALDEAQGTILPDSILFNGGVFRSDSLKNRVVDALKGWGIGSIKVLAGEKLDLAVSQGAASYGRVRASGQGVRIKAGLARSYYLGLQTTAPAIPGLKPKLKAICVAAQGAEEGTYKELDSQRFGLVAGREASFKFFSSSKRPEDKEGAIIEDAASNLESTEAVIVDLEAEESVLGKMVPVFLTSNISETGSLEMQIRNTELNRAWQLEFDLRNHDRN